jgi:hypothetical protein
VRRFALAVAALAGLTEVACAATVTGRVFVDRNRDGVRQADEPASPAASWSPATAARSSITDADGTYRLDVAAANRHRLGPRARRLPARPGLEGPAAGPDLDLPLVALTAAEAAAPLAFVVAADSHTNADRSRHRSLGRRRPRRRDRPGGLAADTAAVLHDRRRRHPGQRARAVRRASTTALAGVGGALGAGRRATTTGTTAAPTYRRHWGPDNYSFDVGNLHVVVWDANLPEATQVAFFAADLAHVDPAMIVVGLGHGSPRDEVADQLAALGVDYLFTGHWHANRKVERTGLTEWGTQTLVMGGIDSVARRLPGRHLRRHRGHHRPSSTASAWSSRTSGVVAPTPGSCAPAGGVELAGGRGPRRRRRRR